jgi:hypothetical protein
MDSNFTYIENVHDQYFYILPFGFLKFNLKNYKDGWLDGQGIKWIYMPFLKHLSFLFVEKVIFKKIMVFVEREFLKTDLFF